MADYGGFEMSDRFKFRAWDINSKKYLEDFYIMATDGKIIYSSAENEDEVIIEQCTGLKDKNGKLIFEGDIVEVTNLTKTYSLKTPVIWEKDIGAFMVWGDKEKLFGNYIGALLEEDENGIVPYTVEVIGNIHDNVELLKEVK